ncbi:MAG: NAD-specific glutamate dehydrogenase [candidate division BRC1 bacterium ADurb.BinA292]|nr:MAG: NAD-specific glutamate dehydrogenase [candidate division BRC1 bacterium ADurb.BinA292]
MVDLQRAFRAALRIAGRDLDDPVSVHQKRHPNPRHPRRRRFDPRQREPPQTAAVRRLLPLALQHVNIDEGLLGLGRRERLFDLQRNRAVLLNHRADPVAANLDAQIVRRHVQQHDLVQFAVEHGALRRRPDRHHLVGVDPLERRQAEELLHALLHQRNPRAPADQDDPLDRFGFQPRVAQPLAAAVDRLAHQRLDQILELVARDGDLQVQRLPVAVRNERQADKRFHGRRQLALGRLGGVLQPAQRQQVVAQIDLVLRQEPFGQQVHQQVVQVIAAQPAVAGRDEHLKRLVFDIQDAEIERSAAEVVDRDDRLVLAPQAVGHRGGGRLVDQPQHLQPGQPGGFQRRLALHVVEIRRHRHDRPLDRFAQIMLGRQLELLQHQGRQLLGQERAVPHRDHQPAVLGLVQLERILLALLDHLVVEAADQALGGGNRPLGLCRRLAPRDFPHDDLPVVEQRDHRRGLALPLGVGNDFGFAANDNGDDGICRSKIDSDDVTLSVHGAVWWPPGGAVEVSAIEPRRGGKPARVRRPVQNHA